MVAAAGTSPPTDRGDDRHWDGESLGAAADAVGRIVIAAAEPAADRLVAADRSRYR